MARGWESKNIEEQQAERERGTRKGPPVSAADAERQSRRQTLELSLARARADRAAARTGAHRAMLDAAIRALEQQLAEG